MLEREDLHSSRLHTTPAYNTNITLVKPRTAVSIPDFRWIPGRIDKPQQWTFNEGYLNGDLVLQPQANHRRIQQVDIQHQKHRSSSQNRVACFMSKEIASRLSITVVNEKSLEMTNWRESRFLPA
jgi:hypothetical protein